MTRKLIRVLVTVKNAENLNIVAKSISSQRPYIKFTPLHVCSKNGGDQKIKETLASVVSTICSNKNGTSPFWESDGTANLVNSIAVDIDCRKRQHEVWVRVEVFHAANVKHGANVLKDLLIGQAHINVSSYLRNLKTYGGTEDVRADIVGNVGDVTGTVYLNLSVIGQPVKNQPGNPRSMHVGNTSPKSETTSGSSGSSSSDSSDSSSSSNSSSSSSSSSSSGSDSSPRTRSQKTRKRIRQNKKRNCEPERQANARIPLSNVHQYKNASVTNENRTRKRTVPAAAPRGQVPGRQGSSTIVGDKQRGLQNYVKSTKSDEALYEPIKRSAWGKLHLRATAVECADGNSAIRDGKLTICSEHSSLGTQTWSRNISESRNIGSRYQLGSSDIHNYSTIYVNDDGPHWIELRVEEQSSDTERKMWVKRISIDDSLTEGRPWRPTKSVVRLVAQGCSDLNIELETSYSHDTSASIIQRTWRKWYLSTDHDKRHARIANVKETVEETRPDPNCEELHVTTQKTIERHIHRAYRKLTIFKFKSKEVLQFDGKPLCPTVWDADRGEATAEVPRTTSANVDEIAAMRTKHWEKAARMYDSFRSCTHENDQCSPSSLKAVLFSTQADLHQFDMKQSSDTNHVATRTRNRKTRSQNDSSQGGEQIFFERLSKPKSRPSNWNAVANGTALHKTGPKTKLTIDDEIKMISRLDHLARSRAQRLQQRRKEKDYELYSTKKECGQCGATQKYDEMIKRKNQCTSCNKPYRYKTVWSDVAEGFMRRCSEFEDRVHTRKQIHEKLERNTKNRMSKQSTLAYNTPISHRLLEPVRPKSAPSLTQSDRVSQRGPKVVLSPAIHPPRAEINGYMEWARRVVLQRLQ